MSSASHLDAVRYAIAQTGSQARRGIRRQAPGRGRSTMVQVDLKQLLGRLNPYVKRALETAAGHSVGRGHYEVAVEHLLLVMSEDEQRDLAIILKQFGLDASGLKRGLQRATETLKTGNTGRPVFSPGLIELLTDAWLISSIELGQQQIRSGSIVAALLASPSRYAMADWFEAVRAIPLAELKGKFRDIVAPSAEEPTVPAAAQGAASGQAGNGALPPDGALARFTINFTEQARKGKIDPVFGRDREIRQMIDILGRRRKNNPICVGDPGVGKTAVVEGLALKMAEGDVPDFLRSVELLSLDLGMLQAGAGVKGEFENRLKGIIDEVKASPKPIVLFIDEAHMLVGAGASAGGGDAANLLKPALARGELRTVAATTWSEYKKYFEKDPALARRFQLVKLDEPSPSEAITIVRGLRAAYEKSHGVYVRDDAVAAAANLSARYISGRQLPDKAVDVLDTACARVKLSLSSKPAGIDDQERRIATLRRELAALERDRTTLGRDNPRIAEIEDEIAGIEAQKVEATAQWEREKALVDRIVALRRELGLGPDGIAAFEAKTADNDDGDDDNRDEDEADEAGSSREAAEQELQQAVAELDKTRGKTAMIHYEVTADAVGQVISDWTGIPVGSMVKDEAAAILGMAANLRQRIKGQDHAVSALDEGMRAAKAGVNNPGQPMGVFLFVGTSGVGKTELATQLADLLFGGERFLVTINMSEFQEKHTVSKLVGAPAGYVGYGEGGLLTEAVRQRPYSVVLLDECEKADPEVLNLFYQVFDKGTLADGEGRVIDFKNTVIILTSNLATDIITAMGTQEEKPSTAELTEAIRPSLSRHFKPALLARMQIVPFYPLMPDVLSEIVRLKLNKVGKRLRESQKMAFDYSDAVVEAITARCTDVDTGARNIDHIVNRTLLPEIATEIIGRMGEEHAPESLSVDIGPEGGFTYRFTVPGSSEPVAQAAE
ncbi:MULTISPECIES: type VI secretion system ATPase TssH [unclassified Bosea (in: a-proteobacteria)]|uniref:type VI secretion system ATPase TssH n=1 Tax=unclassified Bosea (in: a-proteobacteria) TaxID=2653178 RepID=UPI001FCEBAB6|nr:MULTISPECIES: type VI secretion system ATPase TssH [unclassified Bosea (in: a-proteobacteria)]